MAEGRQGGNGVRAEPHNDSESKGGEKGEGTPSTELALLRPVPEGEGPGASADTSCGWKVDRLWDKMRQGVGGHKVLIPLVSRIFSPERPPAPIHLPRSTLTQTPNPTGCAARDPPLRHMPCSALPPTPQLNMCRARSPIPLPGRGTKKAT